MFKELRSVKYLILALVLALIFTVTGCSNNEKSEETVAKIGDVVTMKRVKKQLQK